MNSGNDIRTSRYQPLRWWYRFCLLNFAVVAALGLLLRLHYFYPIPGTGYKYLLDAHSHFAFYGWVTECIYVFVADYISKISPHSIPFYKYLLIFNCLASYGMLFSFFAGGYYWLSIIFSSVALLCSITYCIRLILDTRGLPFPAIRWLRAGALFAVLSSAGIFGIAYTVRVSGWEDYFRASTYFYLHYQYNGMFLFSCVGLLLHLFPAATLSARPYHRWNFYSLAFGCFFGYGLSILWMDVGEFSRKFFTAISFFQLFGAAMLSGWVWRHRYELPMHLRNVFFGIFGLAFLLKFILQMVSSLEIFQPFIFGDRSAVVAYLHLVLLMGVSVFFLWRLSAVLFGTKKPHSIGVLVFAIILNQLLLFSDSFGHYYSFTLPGLRFALLFVSVLIFSAASVSFFNGRRP